MYVCIFNSLSVLLTSRCSSILLTYSVFRFFFYFYLKTYDVLTLEITTCLIRKNLYSTTRQSSHLHRFFSHLFHLVHSIYFIFDFFKIIFQVYVRKNVLKNISLFPHNLTSNTLLLSDMMLVG